MAGSIPESVPYGQTNMILMDVTEIENQDIEKYNEMQIK